MRTCRMCAVMLLNGEDHGGLCPGCYSKWETRYRSFAAKEARAAKWDALQKLAKELDIAGIVRRMKRGNV